MSKVYLFDRLKGLDIFQKEVGYFLTICETSNISKAAEILGIQQSGLSRALSRLESDLGQKLFHRKNTGLTLTDTGRRFLGSLKETRHQWDKSFRIFVEGQAMPAGRLRLGLHSSFGQHFLPRIVTMLTQRFPEIELEVQPLTSLSVLRKICSDELDFGIVARHPRQPELILKEIGSDALGIYATNSSIDSKFLLFNPETQMSNAFLRRFSNLKKVAIKDYDLLALTAMETHIPALLPSSVASKFACLSLHGNILAKSKIFLAAHQNKARSNSFRILWESVIEATLSLKPELSHF